MRKLILLLTFIILSFGLCAETIAQQSFEGLATDTWAYTANPTPASRSIWWGPTTEAMGVASPYDGIMYWAGWDLDTMEHTITFDTVTLNPNIGNTIRFHYFTKNLNLTGDYCRYSIMYDQGSNWDNWVTLQNNTLDWTEVISAIPVGSSFVRLRLSSQFDGSAKYAHWDLIKLNQPDPTAPVVSNLTAVQRMDGSKTVDVFYDLYDANAELCDITLKLSADNGVNYNLIPSSTNLSGDFGDDLPSGINKHIIWNAGAESFSLDGSYLYGVFANDGSSPDSFVYVEGGTFYNDTSEVTISSFFIDKYEITQAGYQAIMGVEPPSGYGFGSDFPVYEVSWFNAIEYCNRRSLQEGLTPSYSYSNLGTNPDNWPVGWNSDNNNHTNVACNWNTTGYRLPTEMEWQFAARGGNQTHYYTYSGSNTIGAVAWYASNSGSSAHSVGTKTANELGIYDMSGNVWEHVWDIYGAYPSGPQNNPTGATSGAARINRGGGWGASAYVCSVSNRQFYMGATGTNGNIGFRVVRISP